MNNSSFDSLLENASAYYGAIPQESIEKYAILFGEGSKYLTQLLRFCWQNNIRTFASCRGHKEEPGPGYIGFLPDYELSLYLMEISDQLDTNGISFDKFYNQLRIVIYVCTEHDFKRILDLLKKYIDFKKENYQYYPRFKNTEELANAVISSENGSLSLDIRNGKSYLLRNRNILVDSNYYCPNATITHILHSKITKELDNSFRNINIIDNNHVIK